MGLLCGDLSHGTVSVPIFGGQIWVQIVQGDNLNYCFLYLTPSFHLCIMQHKFTSYIYTHHSLYCVFVLSLKRLIWLAQYQMRKVYMVLKDDDYSISFVMPRANTLLLSLLEDLFMGEVKYLTSEGSQVRKCAYRLSVTWLYINV